MTSLIQIDLAELDHNLRADMDAPEAEFTAWEYVCMTEDGHVDGNRRLHILHHAGAGRGGIVLTGSGSSGVTDWTDAATPDEVLSRHMSDDMRA